MSNYSASIVRLGAIEPHPNADRLNCTKIYFNNVIIGKNAQEGDLGIYFPVESQLSEEFCSANNLIRKEEIIEGLKVNTGGMFDKNRRVRCQKLRGEYSTGFWIEYQALEKWANLVGIKLPTLKEGDEFESILDKPICQKYIVKQKGPQGVKKEKEAKVLEKLIDGQFRLHCDSENLKKNLHKINPEDIISIGEKYHGANGCFSHILCKRDLNWFEKFLKKIGVKVVDTEYDYVCSSRRVIKNLEGEKSHTSFYGYDIWTDGLHRIKDKIQKGISLYCEVVGMLPSGSWVQPQYDYGAKENDFKVVVFRITYTNPDGQVFEFTQPQIKKYCEKYELETVPFHYYGAAKDMYPELDINNHWHENFLSNLIRDYNEGDCLYCRNRVFREGVVLVKEGNTYEPYKLKSLDFLRQESIHLDSEEVNIEDQ